MTNKDLCRTDLLACPCCGGTITAGGGKIVCSACNAQFPVVDGIPCFAPSDDFYDEYSDVHCPFHRSPTGLKGAVLRFLPFWSYREWRFWRRSIPACGRLLDIGCGQGRELFVERAKEAVGYDGSLQFARGCATHYQSVAVGQLPMLPYRSGVFDAVVSSHVMGHVPAASKERLIAEISRVLRPGGVTAHIIETDSDHPAVAFAKGQGAAYDEMFIKQHGHIGLEYADVVVKRFERHGFRLQDRYLVDAVIPGVLNTRRFFCHPELAEAPGMTWSRRLARWTAGSRVANVLYEVGMGLFHRHVERYVGNPRHAQFILVSFRKQGSDVGAVA